jgi:hypothetical protein
MFCKCYFASIWESILMPKASDNASKAPKSIETKVKLHPVYLPVVSYMAESSAGWWASCKARFQQARRHSQGISEIAYTFLQYLHLLMAVGLKGLPVKTHLRIIGLGWKMSTVHLTNTIHAFAVMLTSHFTMIKVMQMLSSGELWPFLLEELPAVLAQGATTSQGLTYWTVCTILGIFSPLSMMMTYTAYLVMVDSLNGVHLHPTPSSTQPCKTQAAARKNKAETDHQNHDEKEHLSLAQKAGLSLLIWFDMSVLAETTIVIYGLIPEMMACLSLSRSGNRFDYIVADKPVGLAVEKEKTR